MLPGVTALQQLTRIGFSGDMGSCFFDSGLTQLPRLQHMVMSEEPPDAHDDVPPGLLRLPCGMGQLSLSLRHLDLSNLRLAHFPLSLTQLVALNHLNAMGNEFVDLPAGIMAVSRLTELMLGRIDWPNDSL